MNQFQKRALIAFVTFIGGLYFFLEFLLPKEFYGFEFGKYHEEISNGLVVIGVMAIGLGIINILRVHGRALVTLSRGWSNSAALILGLVAMLWIQGKDLVESERTSGTRKEFDVLVLFLKKTADKADKVQQAAKIELIKTKLADASDKYLHLKVKAGPKAEALRNDLLRSIDSARTSFEHLDLSDFQPVLPELIAGLKRCAEQSQELAGLEQKSGTTKRISSLLMQGLLIPLGASMFALLAFYIASAAYRSFRLRSLEATMMMIPAIIVILGQIPQGPLYISEQLPGIRLWLLRYISNPAFRAIFFGSSVAGLAMAMRMWLSLEKSPLDTAGENGGSQKEQGSR